MASITAEKRREMEDEMSRFEQEILVQPGYIPPEYRDDIGYEEDEDFDGEPVYKKSRDDDGYYDEEEGDGEEQDYNEDDEYEEDRLTHRRTPPPMLPPPPPPPMFIPPQMRHRPPPMRPRGPFMGPPQGPPMGPGGPPMGPHGPPMGPFRPDGPPFGMEGPPFRPHGPFGPGMEPRHGGPMDFPGPPMGPGPGPPMGPGPGPNFGPRQFIPEPPRFPMGAAPPPGMYGVSGGPQLQNVEPPPPPPEVEKTKIVYSSAPVINKPKHTDKGDDSKEIKKRKKKKLKKVKSVEQHSTMTGTLKFLANMETNDQSLQAQSDMNQSQTLPISVTGTAQFPPTHASFIEQQDVVTVPDVMTLTGAVNVFVQPEISFNQATGEKLQDGVPVSVLNAKKDKKDKKGKKYLRSAGGTTWEDPTLGEWETDDFRIFCGDLGNEVTDDILTKTFNRYTSFQKARVIRDKKTNKTKGFGFVSFKDPNDFMRAMKEVNGKYVGNRPIKLRKSTWRDRATDAVRRKEKEKKALGFK